jgi:hypothetical protein
LNLFIIIKIKCLFVILILLFSSISRLQSPIWSLLDIVLVMFENEIWRDLEIPQEWIDKTCICWFRIWMDWNCNVFWAIIYWI